jgi:hypothetical protein
MDLARTKGHTARIALAYACYCIDRDCQSWKHKVQSIQTLETGRLDEQWNRF